MKPKTPIQLRLLSKGVTFTQVAKEAGVSYATVRNTIRYKQRNVNAQMVIAKLLGISPERLWKENYNPFYRKQRFKSPKKSNTKLGL